MPVVNESYVVSFDAQAVVEAILDEVDDSLLVVAEYDRDRVNPLYVSDVVRALYEDEQAMNDHFAGIHAYMYLDFTERELFEDLFIESGGVRAFVTYMHNLVAIRLINETEGLFVSLAPRSPVTAVIERVESIIR